MNSFDHSPEWAKKLQTAWADDVGLADYFGRLEGEMPLGPSGLAGAEAEKLSATTLGLLAQGLDRANRVKWRAEKLIEQVRKGVLANEPLEKLLKVDSFPRIRLCFGKAAVPNRSLRRSTAYLLMIP